MVVGGKGVAWVHGLLTTLSLHFATNSAGQKLMQGGFIGKFRFLAWRVAARGARVVVDSTLPLAFVPIRFLHGSCKSVSPRWRRNSLRM